MRLEVHLKLTNLYTDWLDMTHWYENESILLELHVR
jgi:hypothetical protein